MEDGKLIVIYFRRKKIIFKDKKQETLVGKGANLDPDKADNQIRLYLHPYDFVAGKNIYSAWQEM